MRDLLLARINGIGAAPSSAAAAAVDGSAKVVASAECRYAKVAWPGFRGFPWESCWRSSTVRGPARLQIGHVQATVGQLNIDIIEGDVVEYPLPPEARKDGRSKGVGVVAELQSASSPHMCHVEPLLQEEDGWIYDERQDVIVIPAGEVHASGFISVPLSSTADDGWAKYGGLISSLLQLRVLRTWFSERMVPDRISNPHGEHAESLWIIEDSLSPDCGSPKYDD